MRILLLLSTVLTVVLMGDAKADFQTGYDLWESCKPQPTGQACLGYVMAIADALSLQQKQGGGIGGWQGCLRPDVTAVEAADVVTKMLREEPERRHRGAAELVTRALAVAFPCR